MIGSHCQNKQHGMEMIPKPQQNGQQFYGRELRKDFLNPHLSAENDGCGTGSPASWSASI